MGACGFRIYVPGALGGGRTMGKYPDIERLKSRYASHHRYNLLWRFLQVVEELGLTRARFTLYLIELSANRLYQPIQAKQRDAYNKERNERKLL